MNLQHMPDFKGGKSVGSGNIEEGANNFLKKFKLSKNQSRPSPPQDDVFTYRRLRRMIGILGMALPIVLIGLSFFPYFGISVQPSISNYYYTHFREIFTGILCGVGLFLICYKGHNNTNILKNDNFLTNFAGIMAFGVAFFPMRLDNCTENQKIYTLIYSCSKWLNYLHYTFAALLFGTFSLLAIKVFTIGQNIDPTLKRSWFNENNLYRACGFAIIFFMLMIPISTFKYSTIIWETFILLAFSIAWLVKGRALGDKGKIGEKIYNERN